MTATEVLVNELDDAFAHKWDSLRTALNGVTEEEALWQAPCYRDVEQEKGMSPSGTILWQVAHLHGCKQGYLDSIRHRGGDAPDKTYPDPEPTLAGELASLMRTQEAMRNEISALTDADLEMITCKMPLYQYLNNIIRHDIWHSAQIAMARRLYKHAVTTKESEQLLKIEK